MPSLFHIVQLWLMTARKPLMALSVPLIIITKAANATHPVQPVARDGPRGVVEECRLVLVMWASFRAGINAVVLVPDFPSPPEGTRDEGPGFTGLHGRSHDRHR